MAKLSAELNEGQDATIQTQNKTNKAEIQIVDLKQNLTLVKDERNRLQNDLGQVEKELSTEKTKNQNLTT